MVLARVGWFCVDGVLEVGVGDWWGEVVVEFGFLVKFEKGLEA